MGACCSALAPAQDKPRPPGSRPTSEAGSRHGASGHSRRCGPSAMAPPRDSLAAAALPPVKGLNADSSSSSSTSSSSLSGMGSSEESEDESELVSRTSGGTAGPWGSVDWEGEGSEPGTGRRLASVKTTYKLRVGVLEGTTFLNEYIVVDTLGRGSFGKVKLCLNTGNDTLCAVKVVSTRLLRRADKSRLRMGRSGPGRPSPLGGLGPPATSSAGAALQGGAAAAATDTDPTADLRREVEVMRALDHPNVVRLYEVIEDKEGGKLLMVMEYCEAGALVGPGTLTPERHLPEAMAQYYFRQMAAGLAYLHENHVVHGDVKPENVMLSGNGTVKIGDFGQSQFFGRRDVFNRTLGTPAYLAPEVCAGESYRGRQADVWALGVSLYLFIFGQLPFQGEGVLDLYDAIAGQDVPYPRHQPISHELQDLFLRLLHKDPRYRITAAEVMQHPWVKGSAWMALAPGMSLPRSALMESSPAYRDLVASMAHPLASYNAEDLAAVVFPEMQADLAGGSPRSLGGTRTQLVDALVAATAAQAHSPRTQRLHQLAQDSLFLKGWEDDSEGGAGAEGSSTVAPSEAPTDPPPSADGGAETEAAAAAAAEKQASQLARLSAILERRSKEGALASGSASALEAPDAASRGSSGVAAAWATAARPSRTPPQAAAAAGPEEIEAAPLDNAGLTAAQPVPEAAAGRRLGRPPLAPRSVGPDEALRMLPPSPFGSFQDEASLMMQQAASQQQQQQQQQVATAAAADSSTAADGASKWRRRLQRLSGSSAASGGGWEGSRGAPAEEWAVLDPRGLRTSANSEKPRGSRGAGLLRSLFVAPADVIDSSSGGPSAARQQQQQGLVRTHSAPQAASQPPTSPAAAVGAAGGGVDAARRRSGLFAGPSDFIEGVAEAARLPPRPPPRPPQPRPTAARPIVVNVFQPGDRMGQASTTNQQQTCSYIESGVVEIRYEADVPVSLTSVLAAALPWRRAAAKHAAAHAAGAGSAAGSPPQNAPIHRLGSPPVGSGGAGCGVLASSCAGASAGTSVGSPTAGSSAGVGVGSPTGGVGVGSPTTSGPQASTSSSYRLDLEDKVDSSVHGHQVFDLGMEPGMVRRGSELLERSHTLAATVAQATLRAEALLSSAKAGSLDHLLVSERTTGEFLGSLAMLDPRFFQGRWKATAVAKTTVVVVHMTREGLEAFLQQNPLAQVHLRASMARARAEIVKLEALEKIAAAHQAQLQRKARRRRARLPPLAAGGAPAAGPAAAAAGAAGAAPSATLQGLRLPAATGTAAEQAVSAAAAEEAGGESAADGGDEGEEEDPQRDTLLSAGVSSATLELFSVVMKMREALNETMSERLADRERQEAGALAAEPPPSGGSAMVRASSTPLPVPSRR